MVEDDGLKVRRSASWSWAATRETVPTARRTVVAYLRDARTADLTLAAIAVALSEALTNVALHAYSGDAGPVHVAVELAGDDVLIVVSDHGSGVAPRADSPGLGLGLPLMATLCDALDIERPNDGGTRLRMRFRRCASVL
jgi:serine/threonine-protein kinase RsbW